MCASHTPQSWANHEGWPPSTLHQLLALLYPVLLFFQTRPLSWLLSPVSILSQIKSFLSPPPPPLCLPPFPPSLHLLSHTCLLITNRFDELSPPLTRTFLSSPGQGQPQPSQPPQGPGAVLALTGTNPGVQKPALTASRAGGGQAQAASPKHPLSTALPAVGSFCRARTELLSSWH